MMRLLIILVFGIMSLGIQACDYGTTPGDTADQSVEQASGQRSSGLIVPSLPNEQVPVSPETGEMNTQKDNQDSGQGQKSPGYNKQNIGTKVSPFKVVPGTRAHGDPKTW